MSAVDDPDPAVRAWSRMRALVVDQHDRRRAAADALGLSWMRVKALLEVDREQGTLSELADRLAVDRPFATVAVEELCRRGLVRKEHDPDDRRRKIVSPTPAGRRAAAATRAVLDEPPPELRALPAADVVALDRIMAAVSRPATSGHADQSSSLAR